MTRSKYFDISIFLVLPFLLVIHLTIISTIVKKKEFFNDILAVC